MEAQLPAIWLDEGDEFRRVAGRTVCLRAFSCHNASSISPDLAAPRCNWDGRCMASERAGGADRPFLTDHWQPTHYTSNRYEPCHRVHNLPQGFLKGSLPVERRPPTFKKPSICPVRPHRFGLRRSLISVHSTECDLRRRRPSLEYLRNEDSLQIRRNYP